MPFFTIQEAINENMSNKKNVQAVFCGHFPACLKVMLPWNLYDYRYGKAMSGKQPLKFLRRFSFHTAENTVQ
ncbi:MAG TPA: hypothetical protein DD755_06220 [Erysipelotrichaceae bacterium]|jgi:hypothetical protein|nr:hypothetical protein [Erysipelotrichaceae bacterium]